ncbi:MAG TPA: hypothetical protein VLR88_06705 [Propionibacteriaceae bacterium]|nr:hypothetical protein [Propionibacteriaceae bacterium]
MRPSAGTRATRRHRGHDAAPAVNAPAPIAAVDTPDGEIEIVAPSATPTAESPVPAPEASLTPPGARSTLPGGPKLVLAWVTGVLIVALVVFFAVYQIARDAPVTTPTPTPSSPTTSEPSAPAISTAHLITEDEAQTILAKAGWKIAATVPTVTPESPRIACLVAQPDLPNPTLSSQRTLSTATTSKMAVLHQLDNFATDEDAKAVFAARRANLGLCDDVPTWIAGATAVSGLGDEAMSVTIAYQDPVVRYHTVLLVRVGTVVNSFDLANEGTAAAAAPLAQAAGKVTARQCSIAQGACPKDIKAVAAVPSSAGKAGWLVTSDIPRITPGQGLWSETDPAQIGSSGTGCEDLTLKAVPGIQTGLQRTYLLLQDPTAPQNFGVDTILYTLPSEKTASELMNKLTTNIAKCGDRMATATISQAKDISGSGEKGQKVTGRQFIVSQKVGSTTQNYRVSVTATGNKVSYVLVNATTTFNFEPNAWSQLSLRAAQRASQAG